MPEDTIKVIMHGRYQFMTLGAFNKYVDQILSNFKPPTPLSGRNILHTIYPLSCDPRRLSTDPTPFAHVIFE